MGTILIVTSQECIILSLTSKEILLECSSFDSRFGFIQYIFRAVVAMGTRRIYY